MSSLSRHITLAGLATAAVAGLLLPATTASAAVDPTDVLSCLTSSASDVTTLVDPSAPGLPAEIPATHCLQP